MAEVASSSATPVVVTRGDPVSDPSPRTLEALYRESKQVEDKILLRFDSIQVKFSGYDEAVKLLQSFTNKQPTTEAVARDLKAEIELTAERFAGVSAKLAAAEKLTCEKFKGVADSKLALDIRYDQLDGSNKEAVSAALKAAEKAVEKTELNFTKQIDSITGLINANKGTLEAVIGEVSRRVTIMEATKQGTQDGFKIVVSIVGVILTLATIGSLIVAFVK